MVLRPITLVGIMCELLGLSFACPLSADFSIRLFAKRGAENADGWGLAWYPDRSLAIVKEPLDWRESPYSRFLETYQGLRSEIYIAHVRHRSTSGTPTHADTHPFERELAGRHWVFAHNGTIQEFSALHLTRFRPIGGTDSEHLFCHLLELIAARDQPLVDELGWKWLHTMLQDINRRGTLNCLLSDGGRLYCYHDATAWKGLWMHKLVFRQAEERRLDDFSVSIGLDSEPANQGFVVATNPLSETGWHQFQPSQLVVFDHGRLAYSSAVPGTS